jgi:hypothetical protein
LNEEVNDGYGLQFEEEPAWFIKAEMERIEAEIEILEITAEMTADRWAKEKDHLLTIIRIHKNSLEFEMEWTDEVDPAAVALEQERLQAARDKLRKEEEEFKAGEKRVKDTIDLKKKEITVLKDVLRRNHGGHF